MTTDQMKELVAAWQRFNDAACSAGIAPRDLAVFVAGAAVGVARVAGVDPEEFRELHKNAWELPLTKGTPS